ncbi:MAG: alpha-ketoglutarate-dependent dioxygenase AlkB [Acidobacteria bacterium]|nr:alpha-ketoglutarate-dependent dioxygenase AlkB [Acidobacteriota bacterium]MBV9626115.1 alpha-ketoglutarate-dependent dioxygenase AlkB [Acidobacteriota bacterium]
MRRAQLSNFSELPEGFDYFPEFLTRAEERGLLHTFTTLEFQAFNFHGYVARRRIIQYGFEYNFGSRRATATKPIPAFLQPFRERAATWANLKFDEIIEAVVTQYPPGAPIGWHRDVAQFEKIIGISLNSSCRMRFRRYRKSGQTVSVLLEPRSAYLIQDIARWQYEHSISAVKDLRFSITFRTERSQGRRSKNSNTARDSVMPSNENTTAS